MALGAGDFLGLTALSLIPNEWADLARSEVTVLVIPAAVLDELVRKNTRLARELGQQIDQRRTAIEEAVGLQGGR